MIDGLGRFVAEDIKEQLAKRLTKDEELLDLFTVYEYRTKLERDVSGRLGSFRHNVAVALTDIGLHFEGIFSYGYKLVKYSDIEYITVLKGRRSVSISFYMKDGSSKLICAAIDKLRSNVGMPISSSSLCGLTDRLDVQPYQSNYAALALKGFFVFVMIVGVASFL